jgi:F-type H+-transporting ATPase subunit b
MKLMTFLAAAAEPANENPLEKVLHQFGWEPKLFFSQVVLFCIVAFVLAKFAYKPLLAMLEFRRQQISEALQNAEKTRQELANAQVKTQEIIAQANTQANKLIEEARAAAARVQEAETQKAIAAAEQIIVKAREAAAQDHARMLTELRREVGRLVVDTTTKVTGKVLTPDDQKRLADETSRQLAA